MKAGEAVEAAHKKEVKAQKDSEEAQKTIERVLKEKEEERKEKERERKEKERIQNEFADFKRSMELEGRVSIGGGTTSL